MRQWYQTLDHLIAAKEAIETDLYLQLRELFGVQVAVVFYDLTSTSFEGIGPTHVARCGHSRDGRPRNRQVLVGVVMASGWPIASYVFAGNRADRQTVTAVLANVRRRFTGQRVVWVCDRGMVSERALHALVAGEDRYLVGIQRRRNPTAQAVLTAAWKRPGQPLSDGGRAIEGPCVSTGGVVSLVGIHPLLPPPGRVDKAGSLPSGALCCRRRHRYRMLPSDCLSADLHFALRLIGDHVPAAALPPGGGGSPQFSHRPSHHSEPLTPRGSWALHSQALRAVRGLRPFLPGSAPLWSPLRGA